MVDDGSPSSLTSAPRKLNTVDWAARETQKSHERPMCARVERTAAECHIGKALETALSQPYG